jgi:molybdate transport system substrate-binding protein
MFLLLVGNAAEAAEIKVLSALAMMPVMEDLGPKFERATGRKLAITFVTVGEAVKRVHAGETADVAILPQQGIFPKTAGGAAVGALVASGEAELGLQQIQELIPVTGIEIAGPLPGDLQNNLLFAATVMAGAKDAEASKALVNFLRTPEAAVVIKAKGMEPATP